MKIKIAVFGSAFNPPTLGHKSVIDLLTHFDQILLLPSISHAWGKEMLAYELRCQLIDAFIKDLNNEQVKRSTAEESLFKPNKKVTTYEVLKLIQEKHPDADITFIIGPDNLFQFSKFYKADKILQRWSVMACPETVSIRSTNIRELLAGNLHNDLYNDVVNLTTPSVAELLSNSMLYRVAMSP